MTTVAKAKELRHLADHMITLAKANPSKELSAIRQANKIIFEKPVLTKLFQVLGPRYEKRDGGYTRVLKLSKRRDGDNAEMAVMEYVDRPSELRAARPPTSVQQEIMQKYIKEKLGIEPLIGESMTEIEEELRGMNLKSAAANDNDGSTTDNLDESIAKDDETETTHSHEINDKK